MKKMMIVASMLLALSTGLSAQNLNFVTATANPSQNSCNFSIHINGLTAVGFYQISWGPTPNYNLNSSTAVLIFS